MIPRLRVLLRRLGLAKTSPILGRVRRVALRVIGLVRSATKTTVTDVIEPPQRRVQIEPIANALWDDSDPSALGRLQEIEAADDVALADRVRASTALARWFANDDPHRALGHITVANALRETFDGRAVSLEADCLYNLGRFAEARRLLATAPPEPETTIRIGRARAAQHDLADHGSGPMMEALAELYGNANLTMAVRDCVDEPLSISNIRSASSRREPGHDTPTVSVVLTVDLDRDPSLASLSSLIAQSWRPLEIVAAVDESDSSGLGQVKTLRDVAAVDAVEVVLAAHPPHLDGPERRAHGLARSSGQLVAFHDVAEWSHPLRIEVEASQLCRDGELAAAGSHHCVVDERLLPVPSAQGDDPRLIVEHGGGMLFRRTLAESFGSPDGAGVVGAAERHRLVVAAHGGKALLWADPGVPLALTLAGDLHDRRDHRTSAA